MIKDIIFFPNGNTAVFDEHGEQIPDLQWPWLKFAIGNLMLNAQFATELFEANITMPDGRGAKLIKAEGTKTQYNWSIIDGKTTGSTSQGEA